MKTIVISLFAILIICGCENLHKEKQVIKIATAANMQFAIKEIAKEFTNQTQIECEFIIGSSGKLATQIEEGAPYDVFISANMIYPQRLIDIGKANGEIKIYALGKLVMLTLKEDIELSFNALTTPTIKHIAIANPETAPYGISAFEVFETLGLTNKIRDKLVYGESISQTNQFILTESAEIGFTALSLILSPEMQGKGKWIEVDDSLYSPIQQGAIVINSQNTFSQKFVNFLSSESAHKILKEYGYEIIQ